MAYWITAFGSTTLSTSQPMQDTGPGDADLGLVSLPGGGVHDPWGTDQAPVQLPYPLRINATLLGDAAAMRTALYELRAQIGVRDELYRTPDDPALSDEWAMARLAGIRVSRRVENYTHLPITLEFSVLEHPWHGDDATVNDVIDAAPTNVVCVNGGNARVDDAVITITAAGSNITVLTITVAGVTALEWAGVLGVGTDLVIDCGARTVTNNGVEAYDELTLGAGHVVAEWLRLPPGNTTVAVTRTGGDNTSAIEIAFDDGWA